MCGQASGKVWRDPTLDDWPKEDYRRQQKCFERMARLFCGDLGNEVTDDLPGTERAQRLSRWLSASAVCAPGWQTPSGSIAPFRRPRPGRKSSSRPPLQVIRDKRTGKTKGYGFVSFSAPEAQQRDIFFDAKQAQHMLSLHMLAFHEAQTWN